MNTKSLTGHAGTTPQGTWQRVLLVVTALSLAASVLVVTALLPAPASAQDGGDATYSNVDQRDVASFVDAGVSIAQAYNPENTDAVVLATDANFPDALAASAVAGAVDGPVLFTAPDSLSPATSAEIERLLDPGSTIYLMGGPEAISEDVEAELSDYDVRRLAGETRIETAVEAAGLVGVPSNGTVIIARAFGPGGANTESDRTTGWVDAVSCGAFAAANGIPIFLTQTSQLSASASVALDASSATDAIVCGGPAAVSDQVLEDLQALDITPTRVAGDTRIETAIATAIELFDISSAAGQKFTIVNGYGELFGYGLAAAPLGDPILLVGTDQPTSCVDERQPARGTLCFLQTATEEDPAMLLVVGDDSVIAPDVVAAVSQFSGGVEGVDPSELDPLGVPDDVTAVDDLDDDGTRLNVSWDAVSDPDDILVGYNVYVDGQRRGSVPTVGASTTTYQVTGLTEDVEVEVQVTSLDEAGRESDLSDAATATPEDEVPAAIANFVANPGNTQASLGWDAGPLDFKNYVIGRAEPGLDGACPTSGFTTIKTITTRTEVTLVDEGLTNGDEYCYRITTTDQGDNTSPPSDVGPITPAAGIPQVSITFPTAGGQFGTADTAHFGPPTLVEYTVTDTDTEFKDLRVSLQLSYDGGARGSYEDVGAAQAPTAVTDGSDGRATFSIPSCAANDQTTRNCMRDVADTNVRVRLIVTDPAGDDGEDNSGNFSLVRTPPAVSNLSANGIQNGVDLKWDRLNVASTIVPRYEILRKAVNVQPDSDAGSDSCSDPTTSYQTHAVVNQPAATVATLSYTDTQNIDADGNTLPNGSQVTDVLYCYQVRGIRDLGEGQTAPGENRVAAGNPTVAEGISVSLTSPPNNDTLRQRTNETLKYRITAPAGTTIESVNLEYCLDFSAPNPFTAASCQDTDGWKAITTANGLASAPPKAVGSNSVTWRVPDGETDQGDDDSGAIQVRVSGAPNPGRATGIKFR